MNEPNAKKVAPGVYHLPLFGQASINAYVIGKVLIDAGIRSSQAKLERLLGQYALRAHALTHVHADHQGASHHLCATRAIPLWTHKDGIEAMEHGGRALRQNMPNNPITTLQRHFWSGPPHPVARGLRGGDEVDGFEVLETPGHAKGHVSFWRESDRVLVIGDVLTNMSVVTGQLGLHQPLGVFTLDAEQNREQIRRLAKLEPALVLFGHGPPLRDPEALLRFAGSL